MRNYWKQFAELATRLRTEVVTDLFESARIRIILLYVLMGTVILIVAGTLVYEHIIYIVQSIIEIIRDAILSNAINGGSITDQGTGELAASTVNNELWRMISTIGVWVVLALLVSAYLLADITLKPIKRAHETQKRFVANVSHELRTPLSIMRTESEAALVNVAASSKEELVETLRSNIEEIDRMSKILQFLLNFSSFENKMKSLNMGKVNLGDMIERTVKMMMPTADKKGVTIETFIDSPAFITGSTVALEEMILNLIKNSIRHTPTGGRIDVEIEHRLYGNLILSVKDTGAGISAENISHIFDPFYKGTDINSDRQENFGLGLAIVKDVVTFHRGSISVKSVVGKGTKISIKLHTA